MRKLFGALVAAALTLTPTLAYAGQAPDVLVAHRGVAGKAEQLKYQLPENSIPAWQWAIDNCADIVDLDAQVTSDGMLAVMHDETIDRTTNRTGDVQSRTLQYIKDAYLELPQDLDGNGNDDNTIYHPPSLSQALDFLKGKTDCNGQPVKICIELKSQGWTRTMVGQLKTALQGKGLFTTRVNVHSSNLTNLGYARDAGYPNLGYAVTSTAANPSAATVKQYGGNVFVWVDNTTASKINEYDKAGIRVWMTTLDDTADYQKAWDAAGPDHKVYAWVVNDLLNAKAFLAAQA
jgi:glycerophosphoryl diester phosphodiesterase